MLAFGAFYPRKPEMRISALQVAPDDIHHIGAPEAIPFLIAVVPHHLQPLEMVLRATVIIAVGGFALAVAVGKKRLHSHWLPHALCQPGQADDPVAAKQGDAAVRTDAAEHNDNSRNLSNRVYLTKFDPGADNF